MKECPFCQPKQVIDDWDLVREHLIVTKNAKNALHVHGPLDNKDTIIEFIDAIKMHSNIFDAEPATITTTKPTLPKEIIIKNRQAIGDILTMTCLVRDFKKAYPDIRLGVKTTAMHVWDFNPYLDHTLTGPDELIIDVGPGLLTNRSNSSNLHMCNAFRISLEEKLNITIPQGPIYPDIWMTEEEYNRPPLIEGPYWIIIVGGEPGWPVKMYPMDRWQEVVNSLPEIQFVQLGVKSHPYPHLENVIDYIGKTEDRDTGIRDLFNIFLHAQGSLSLVSMAMHLAASFNLSACVIAGAREPHWFTHYLGQQYIQTNGCLPCATRSACWKCVLEGCIKVRKDAGMTEINEKIPKCVDIIHPSEVVESIRKYYKGGRLQYGKKIKNTFFKNIVKEAKVFSVQKPILPLFEGIVAEKPLITNLDKSSDYGIPFGGNNITTLDWEFLKEVIQTYNIKTILEFGLGLSTVLFSDTVTKLVTYETTDKCISIPNKILDIRRWDGITINEELSQFDLVFVDGPSGGRNREMSIKIASEYAKFVIIHDENREYEKKWQNMHIADKYNFVSKGGSRCALWVKKGIDLVKKEANRPAVNVKVMGNHSHEKIRIIFNGRGDGGAERTITWIANRLYDLGYDVIYHSPTGIPCGTFKTGGNKSIPVLNLDTVTEPCAVAFLYTNDWIWEFSRRDKFDWAYNLHADRKVMGINYKVGPIGNIDWTAGWDKYLFLNSDMCNEVAARMNNKIKTVVMAPPTPLDEYLKIQPDYNNGLRIVRHSSQGDVKYPKNMEEVVLKIITCRDDVTLRLMPKPTFLDETKFDGKVIVHQRNQPPVPEFLQLGNCFNYVTPEGYTEGGPKVCIEALASGIPVIARNFSGMKDRVTNETGWLFNNIDEMISIIKNITSKDLETKGKVAKEFAIQNFVPERWIQEIILGK